MKKFGLLALHIFFFLFLTILTQIGGIIYLISFLPHRFIKTKIKNRWLQFGAKMLSFIVFYCLFTFLIVPPLAMQFGRIPLPITAKENIQPSNALTVILNRNYVSADLKNLLENTARAMQHKYPGFVINYLDANHPFINGAPMIFHLSHKDGKKIDLSFCYKDSKTGIYTYTVPTFSGYGVFEAPLPGEENMPEICKQKGYWQYSFSGNIKILNTAAKLQLDNERTKELLRLLAINPATQKIFLEPHLKTRLGLTAYNKIRFHGCHAARHDDHIHLQVH